MNLRCRVLLTIGLVLATLAVAVNRADHQPTRVQANAATAVAVPLYNDQSAIRAASLVQVRRTIHYRAVVAARHRAAIRRHRLVTLPHTGVVHWAHHPGDPTDAELAILRWCEGGKDGSHAVNSKSGARGWYQFLLGTWYGVGGHGDPARASFSEQTYRAILLYRREGWTPWRASRSCTGLY